jgi:hypothetical protein
MYTGPGYPLYLLPCAAAGLAWQKDAAAIPHPYLHGICREMQAIIIKRKPVFYSRPERFVYLGLLNYCRPGLTKPYQF